MKTHLNLIPAKIRCRQMIQRTLWIWLVACGLAVTVIVPVGWMKWSSAHARQLQVASLEREFEPIRCLKIDLNTLRDNVKQASQRTTVSFDFNESRPLPTLIAAISQAAAEAEGNVSVESLVLDRNLKPEMSDGGQAVYQLVLKGIATDSADLARFVAGLRRCQLFQRVDQKSTIQSSIGEIAVERYEVACTF